eukprot:scaffold55618_cov40-Tisochrysis_lutea.AAC.2
MGSSSSEWGWSVCVGGVGLKVAASGTSGAPAMADGRVPPPSKSPRLFDQRERSEKREEDERREL